MKNKCYIYTRVSTSMQVDGYSLDAQKDRLYKYAEYQELFVAGEYSDEGKSGKNVEGRPDFVRMLRDIEDQKDNVRYVLVFKLSRFGRNAADVLTSLQTMQDFGVDLICVEDGIDSSKDSGKLMISVLSSVAEIERENILVQTMEGRRQKAREGKWNGGFAPYGYKLENGELVIEEFEADVIRQIYDLYLHTNKGIATIASYLNSHGYKKRIRQNGSLDTFSASFVTRVLDNPVYCGKLAYGRRKTEKIQGKRNAFHIVKQDKYDVYDGIHQPIISEEDWKTAVDKRTQGSRKWEKKHSLEHEHILSGILRCPVCGGGMYGNVNRKRKSDGTNYKDYFYYACKHRTLAFGHPCNFKKQLKEDKINDAVVEEIRKVISNESFAEAIKDRINARIDTDELNKELDALRKQLRQEIGSKNKLSSQMDSLDITDRNYDRKYRDMQNRLDVFYDRISEIENKIDELETRIHNLYQQKITGDNVYKYLLYFDQLYDKMTDKEKKQFMNSFITAVDVFEKEQPNGRILKRIGFAFPVFYGDKEVRELSWDNETTVETVVLLSQQKPDDRIEVVIDLEELELTCAEAKATYNEIKDYVFDKYGLNVSTLYISQIKRKCGIAVGKNYNLPKSDNSRVPNCPKNKEEAIIEALQHFKMI